MTCLTNNGINLGCGNQSSGGLKNVWITDHSNIDFESLDISDGLITGMTDAFEAETSLKEYQSNDRSASFVEEWAGSIENGATGYNQLLTMKFSKMENDKRNEMRYLTSTRTIAIIEDNNGKFWLVGAHNGLRPSDVNTNIGATISDGNNYNVVLSSEEPELAYEIESKSLFESEIE